MPNQTILVVDDEQDILKLLQYNLEKEGYRVLTAKSGEDGLEIARSKRPDLVVLDLMLPGMDGLEVCKILKNSSETKNTPVLMLTAKSTEVDQVVGLEIGASDYIAKPFSVKVFLARVKNVLRVKDKPEKNVIKIEGLVLDNDRRSVSVNGKPVAMTKLEFNILKFLMANPGKVFSRDQLLNGAWGQETFVVDRTVDVHVKSIRKKIGKYRDWLETVRGSGYCFSDKAHGL